MRRALERLLNLRPGDVGRGLALFSYLFLIIASYVLGQVVRDALFLARFPAEKLPYVDISIFALVGIVVAAYIRIGRRVNLGTLLVGSLLAFAALGALFWLLARRRPGSWLYPTIYIWVGVLGALAPAQVWTLANYILTPREAKRLFGLMASGATLGSVFGGVSAHAAARRYGAESLLWGITALLVLAALLAAWIWRRSLPTGAMAAGGARDEGPRTLRESVQMVRASPYLQAIAAVICISSFATSVAGWQFKAIAQDAFVRKDALAAFFGAFNASAGAATLLVQVLITSRVLSRLGLGAVLMIVPLTLVGGSAALLMWGGLVAATWLKGSDKILRYSIDRPAVELLYLPLPSHLKVQVKSFIDIVVWRLGDGLAGLSVLIFATFGGLSPREVSWVNLAFLGSWLGVAVLAQRRYLAVLRESIQNHRLDVERASAPVLDRRTTEVLASQLDAGDPQEILYALSLLNLGRQQAVHPAVRGLLAHPSPEVREKALAILNAAGDKGVRAQAEHLLADPDLRVRTEALLYLAHQSHMDPLGRIQELGDFSDFSVRSAMVAFLARSGEGQNLDAARVLLETMVGEEGPAGARTRLEAARLVGALPEHFEEQLQRLIADPDIEVAREAIQAAGRRASAEVLSSLLARLGEPRLAPHAGEALGRLGDGILATLNEKLEDPAVPIAVRREIPSVLVQIGTVAAAEAVVQHLLEPDIPLRTSLISALNKLRQLHPALSLDAFMLEAVLAAEIMGHYRSYQVLATLDGEEANEPLGRGLREAMNREVERIFRLMGLLFPRHDLHSAYVGLQSDNRVVHDQALDFLDHILKPSMRSLLVPLLDRDVNVAERVRLANRLVGAPVETREQAVSALLSGEDPWLRSCAAYAIGALGLRDLEHELDAWRDDPDPLLRETVRQAKQRLAAMAKAAG